jgi:hypothetical protein
MKMEVCFKYFIFFNNFSVLTKLDKVSEHDLLNKLDVLISEDPVLPVKKVLDLYCGVGGFSLGFEGTKAHKFFFEEYFYLANLFVD